jgi:predicted ester cyclase
MEEVLLEKEVSAVQTNMEDYFKTHDVKYVAEDAVFTHMSTGDRYEGREAIGQMLHYMYHVAFDAHAEIASNIVTKDKALLEANFIGKHVGEFAGLQPTDKTVNVPFCVTYELKDNLIQEGRVYMLMDVMMRQLTS